jgi:ribosomal protein L44E
LGFEKLGEKVGENSGESVYEKCVESTPEFEVIGDIQVPLPKAPKNSFTPKPNHLCNKLDTTQVPPKFPPKANDFQKPVKFVSEKGVKPREKPESKPKPIPFSCEYCGKERHQAVFCYKKKREDRLAREQANQDRYHQSHGIPEPRVPLPRGVGSVKNVVELELRVVGSHREVVVRGLIKEMMVCVLVRGLVGLVVVLLDVPLLVLSTGLGEMITTLGSRGTTDHAFPLVVLVLLPWDMGNLVERE